MGQERFSVLPILSNTDWISRKKGEGHYGTVDIAEGEFILDEGKLSSGRLAVSIGTLKVFDVLNPGARERLEDYLRSDDYLCSQQYPEASILIHACELFGGVHYIVNGDLQIKGITRPIVFQLQVRTSDQVLTAIGKLTIDSKQYELERCTGAFLVRPKERVYYHEIDVNVNIIAKLS